MIEAVKDFPAWLRYIMLAIGIYLVIKFCMWLYNPKYSDKKEVTP